MAERDLTEIEVVCRHYLLKHGCKRIRGEDGFSEERRAVNDQQWECPECGKQFFSIDTHWQTAGCGRNREGCRLSGEKMTSLGVIAALGGYDPRSQRREIHRERRSLLEAQEQRNREEDQKERDDADWRSSLEEAEFSFFEEGGYSVEERREALRLAQRLKQNESRPKELELEAKRRDTPALRQVLGAYSRITLREVYASAAAFAIALAVVFYGISFLDLFANSGGPGPLSPVREFVRNLLPELLVELRFLVGAAVGAVAFYVTWSKVSFIRRFRWRFSKGEHVAVYSLNEKGEVLWRDSGE